jgi:hypothetical protein
VAIVDDADEIGQAKEVDNTGNRGKVGKERPSKMLECSRYVRKELVKLDDDANQKQLEAQG